MDLELNKLYLADCYEFIKQIPAKSIDLIITDPPYELEVNHSVGRYGDIKKLSYEQIANMSNGFDYSILDEFIRVLKKINIYIWCSKKQLQYLLDYFVTKHKCYWEIINWHKENAVPTGNNTFISDTEYCLFFRQKGVHLGGDYFTKRKYYVAYTNRTDKAKFQHPTIKPLHIIKNFVINSSKENDIVFDPFVGSGTTAVACKELNRQFIACEINEDYYNTAINRLNQIRADGQMTMFLE